MEPQARPPTLHFDINSHPNGGIGVSPVQAQVFCKGLRLPQIAL
jgi:hypothetical protein